jgi:hypothetical protein
MHRAGPKGIKTRPMLCDSLPKPKRAAYPQRIAISWNDSLSNVFILHHLFHECVFVLASFKFHLSKTTTIPSPEALGKVQHPLLVLRSGQAI